MTALRTTTVVDLPKKSRYEVELAGKNVGFASYHRRPGAIAFTHTQIDPAHNGEGIGTMLARRMLDDARKDGLSVLPYCPFLARFIARNPEYLDLVPAEKRERFGLKTEPKRYHGAAISVTFDRARCLHAAECLRGLPSVFDTSRRPWILPDEASADRVEAVIRKCPSGALHYERPDGPAETPDAPTHLTAREDEPLWVRGDIEIETADGPIHETRAALCHCGKTDNTPFCDGSGPCVEWRR
jgi:uncharacterized Fe-S cluster protein YjdI/predicted GNAT family acetyltransferase/CDGSH-type Zn-finger protein